jgi:hypothetical protein
MQVALADFGLNTEKYLELTSTQDVILTKFGKPKYRITQLSEHKKWEPKEIPDVITTVEQLFGIIPPHIDIEKLRMEKYSE